MHEAPDNEQEDKVAISNEEWCSWLLAEVRQSASYAEYHVLLDECCEIASKWRERFWDRKALWTRIRKGRRLAKELSEVVPVLARVRAEVDAFEIAEGAPKLIILDLCSGFGYMGMFMSELLDREKVERIVLVDKMWAPLNVERQAHHVNPEHIMDDDWPIRLSTSRVDLKVPSDRRSLVKYFLSRGSPAMLLGVHLCGTLSLRCIELWNDCPSLTFLALKPCCLPDPFFSKRGDVFGAGGSYSFPAKAVCAAGKWSRGRWIGGAGREELEKKYACWVRNLSLCAECDEALASSEAPGKIGAHAQDSNAAGMRSIAASSCGQATATRLPGSGSYACGSGVVVERHVVQEKWFQNVFIFGRRKWSQRPPSSSIAQPLAANGSRLPNTTNNSGVSEARRLQLLEELDDEKRQEKRARRRARWTAEQRAQAERKHAECSRRRFRATVEPIGRSEVRLRFWIQVHEGVLLPLG